jgi:8-oxo-dGTP pyrophosphatase MutT (NUDIX family)
LPPDAINFKLTHYPIWRAPLNEKKVSQLSTKRAKSMGTWMTRPLKKQKLEKRAQRGKPIVQVAALPYRHTAEGVTEILLLTSRQTGRFILPKGWPMKGRRDCEASAEEAAEEAAEKAELVGNFHEQNAGSFHYWKRLKGVFTPVVDVYPFM